MEIKETVKTKLVHVKDEAVAVAAAVAPYMAVGVACGFITYVTAKATYVKWYSQGVLNGAQAGKNAVIDIISDLAKSVETK